MNENKVFLLSLSLSQQVPWPPRKSCCLNTSRQMSRVKIAEIYVVFTLSCVHMLLLAA